MQARTLVVLVLTAALVLTPVLAFPPAALFAPEEAPAATSTDDHSLHDHSDHGHPATGVLDAETRALAERLREQVSASLPDDYVRSIRDILCSTPQVPCTVPTGHDDDPIPDEVEPFICEFVESPALPEDGECTDEGQDYTPSSGPVPSPTVPPVPSDSDEPTAPFEDLMIAAWDNVSVLVNLAGEQQAQQQRGRTTMQPAAGDADGDGRPDSYRLTFDTTRDCLHPINGEDPCTGAFGQKESVFIQSDYLWSGGDLPEGMIIDPRTGDAFRAGATLNADEESLWLSIFKGDDEYLRITLDWTMDENDKLVLEVYDSEASHIAAPTYPTVTPIGLEEGTPIYWSAPFDLSYVAFFRSGDLDRDEKFDWEELAFGSNPLNKRSVPTNLDGDACPRSEDPDDSNPFICKGFPYLLEALTPDSNPADDQGNVVWEIVPLTFSATLRDGFDPEVTPQIKSWHAYISFTTTTAHSLNETLTNDKTTPPCDLLPTSAPPGTSNPQHGTTHDGDPMDHGQCPYMSPPNRKAENPANWQVWTHVCQGQGHLTAQVCPFDTKTIADGKDYHFFFDVCLVGEDCAALIQQGQFTDHIGLSDHFEINNKPVLELHTIRDADNVTDRDGPTEMTTPISDFAELNITTFHAQGYDIGRIQVHSTIYVPNNQGRPAPVGLGKTWVFEPAGVAEGVRIPASKEGNLLGNSDITAENATGFITLVNASTGNWTVEIDTKEIEWRHEDFYGFKLTVESQGTAGPPIKNLLAFPNYFVKHFNNRAPEISNLHVEELEKPDEDQNTTVTVRFRYVDPDFNPQIPDLTAYLMDNETGEVLVESTSCESVPDSPPDSVIEPSGAYDRDYRCTLTTDRYDDHKVTIRAIDQDRGDNASITEPILAHIPNLPPELDDLTIESDPQDATSEGSHRNVTFHIRYHDAEDVAASVAIELFTRPDEGPQESLGTFEMATGETCVGTPTRASKDGVESEHCYTHVLAPGNYSLKIHAESLRNHTTDFPRDGLEDFDVSEFVEIGCTHCGTDEKHANAIRDQTLMAVQALNEVLEQNKLPEELQPYSAPQHLCLVLSCPTGGVDSDNDGSSDEEENRTGTDPNNHWSNPYDTDADLVPFLLDGTVLDSDLLEIKGDGQVVLRDEPSLKVYMNTAPGAAREKPVVVFEFNKEDDLYTLTVQIGPQPTRQVSGLILDYEITETGFDIIARNLEGAETLRLRFDAANIGVAGEHALNVTFTNDAMFAYARVSTNPFDVSYGSHASAVGENSLYGLIFADREQGAVTGTNNGDEYTLCVTADVCIGIPISRFGFEEGQGPNSLPGPWVDPEGDGNRTYLIPEDAPDVPPDLPPTPDTDDEDGDQVPDDAEAILCSTIPIGTDLCDEDDLVIPPLPGGPDGVDDDQDGVPDDVEPTICEWEFRALDEDGHCTDDDEDGTNENYHAPVGGGA